MGAVRLAWGAEEIPDPHRLFMRVHVKGLLEGGKLHPGIFREQDGAISTDWEKYSTAEESRNRAKQPEKNGVIALIAGRVRRIEGLAVRHSPDVEGNNRAHTDILGVESPQGFPPEVQKTAMRARLYEQFNDWEIRPPELAV